MGFVEREKRKRTGGRRKGKLFLRSIKNVVLSLSLSLSLVSLVLVLHTHSKDVVESNASAVVEAFFFYSIVFNILILYTRSYMYKMSLNQTRV